MRASRGTVRIHTNVVCRPEATPSATRSFATRLTRGAS